MSWRLFWSVDASRWILCGGGAVLPALGWCWMRSADGAWHSRAFNTQFKSRGSVIVIVFPVAWGSAGRPGGEEGRHVVSSPLAANLQLLHCFRTTPAGGRLIHVIFTPGSQACRIFIGIGFRTWSPPVPRPYRYSTAIPEDDGSEEEDNEFCRLFALLTSNIQKLVPGC
ncbi:hypothetical protein AVEN_178803-1 [Araneus ventricosus]|uniref:Uncharacterized protein n=1 Tax=Araneus ventricosus TaxID=182803 RepID=A0A4Y2BGT9_ARAVE|nr:hypothetical protein AVEN_178803-1 [Araneus ventricosus]